MLTILQNYDLIENKHIPFDYLTASYNDRIELLAGLLDSDGYLESRGKRTFEITQKNEQLAKNIVFLARSIGCHATIKKIDKSCIHKETRRWGEYFLVLISRNIEKIPTRIERKKASFINNAQRTNLHYGIRHVEPIGEGDYYGFVLDGNQKFLGGDFTILHNTGKSWSVAWMLDWHLRTYDESNAMITATNIEQIRSVVWKELDTVIADVNRGYPWMVDWFIKETKRYYVKGHKDSWYVIPKTASKAAPENIAGQHRRHYICIVDEASGVEDEIIGVLRGALTHEENRFAMFSQPTRQVGHFAEAFSSLKSLYKTFNLNSEESPIVSKKFIHDKLVEYGGHHSPEYQIKVLGRLPDNLSGFLIPKSWCTQAQAVLIEHDQPWGWVMTADVAEGVHRDSSVWTLARVSGYGVARKVEVIDMRESLGSDELVFAREMYSEIVKYPRITVAVDADGPGRTVILTLEELGVTVERIHWGLPPHAGADRKRYKNQRAYASVKAREAILDDRFRICPGTKIVNQASRIPYKIDEAGRYAIMPKEQMKSQGIKSPDLFDTHCFFFLCDYVPADTDGDNQNQYADDLTAWAVKILEGEPA